MRILGDSARRVAQFQAHYFHNTIEELFRRRAFEQRIEAALNEVGYRMGHSTEEMLSWVFRRHAEISTEHHFEHAETALEEAGSAALAARNRGAQPCRSPATRGSRRKPETTKLRARHSVLPKSQRDRRDHRGDVVKMLGESISTSVTRATQCAPRWKSSTQWPQRSSARPCGGKGR